MVTNHPHIELLVKEVWKLWENQRLAQTLGMFFFSTIRALYLTLETERYAQKCDSLTLHKGFKDFEIRSNVSKTHNFLGTFHHP